MFFMVLSPQCFDNCQIPMDSVNVRDPASHDVTRHGKAKRSGGYRCGYCRKKNYNNHINHDCRKREGRLPQTKAFRLRGRGWRSRKRQ